ncbi:MAG: double-stranded RNA binding motif domain-containing protein [Trueperaceae bacterium]
MAHPKGVLIERLQKEGRQPRFETAMGGPDHEPVFDAEVFVDDASLGTGRGSNKRSAERLAAEEALATLDAAEAEAAAPKRGKGRGRGAAAKEAPPKDRDGASGRRGGRGRGRSEAEDDGADDAAPEPAAAAPAADHDAPFDGPWPVFDAVLATSLRIAHERVAVGLGTQDARNAIETFALDLYKNVLSELGEVIEEEVDEPA